MKKSLSPRQVFERTLTENDVLSAIRSLLELNGARVHRIVERIPWGKTTSTPGIPDLNGYWPRIRQMNHGYVSFQQDGHPHIRGDKSCCHFWIEVKRPGGKLRPAQAIWLAQAELDGVIAFKAESVEEMVSEFKKHGIEIKGV